MRENENGYIVIEVTLAFTMFTLLIISILTLINIVSLQAKVHYALTQTASEVSMYCYSMSVLGLDDEIMALAKTGDEVEEEISGVVSDLEDIQNGVSDLSSGTSDVTQFFSDFETIKTALSSLSSTASSAASDPTDTLVALLRYGLDGAKDKATQEWIIRPMFNKYMATGSLTGEQYMFNRGMIEEPDLSASQLIDADGDVLIVATYRVDYTFGILPLPFTELEITQTAKTKAWLGGVALES